MGPELIASLIALAVKYGPDAVTGIIKLWHSSHTTPATVADVESAFARLKTYEAYDIPDVPPGAPLIPAPAPAG